MNLTNQKTRRKAAFLLAVGLLEAASPVFAAPMVSITHEQETIVLNVQGTTIEGVFRYIERHSSYVFAYDGNVRNRLTDPVNISLHGRDMETLIRELCQATGLQYSINGKQVLIKEKRQTEKPQQGRQPATHQVKGTVKDAKGEPLIGATIMIKGTDKGTVTDLDGNFALDIPDGATLTVSYVGFNSQDIRPGAQHSLNVNLLEDNNTLNELVVVGYGVQKKSDVTGALVRVSEKDLSERPVANALEAMQGKAAGVDITSNERPGEIGTIYVRGVRSLSASNSPLYVVDGVPIMSTSGIETLNPNDIASIDVLKDASATAIYGSRGANGVILVTTKQGLAGKTTINYNGSITWEHLHDYSRMMNAGEYIDFRRWAYYYSNPSVYPRGDKPTEENDYKIFNGSSDPTAWANIKRGWENGTWDGSKVETYNWGGLVTRTGITHEHTLSVSGGSEKMKGYASFGYLNNEGTVKDESYERFTLKSNLEITPAKWFLFGVNMNGTYSNQYYGQNIRPAQSMFPDQPSNLYATSTGMFPYAKPYDAEGNRIDYPGADDAVKTVAEEWLYNQNKRRLMRFMGNAYAELNIGEIVPAIKGLRYRINFGPDLKSYRNGNYQDAKSVSRVGSPNYASLTNQSDISWTLDNLIYYNNTFGKHSIGLTLLQSATKYHYDSSTMSATDIPLASAKWNALTKQNISKLDNWGSSLVERQLLSYMYRINYDFANKYLLTVSGRWDGASQLAEGNKWAFFPSVAMGWRMEEEAFMKDINWIQQLKLRFGVGVTGNSAIDPYQTKGAVVSLYYPFGNNSVAGRVPSEYLINGGDVAMANQDLTWEKTTQYNLGLDFSLLKGRISGVFDFYISKTRDLLMAMSIPSLNGYTNTYANIGKTSNVGFDLTINTINIKLKDFEWATSINTAWQKDKIDELSNGKEDDINNNWFIGQSLGVIYGYQSAGLWKEEDAEEMAKFNANGHKFEVGMARPVDQNKDYKIDPNDDRVIIGNTRPRWTFGMTNNFTYKNIDLSIMVYGRFGYTVNTDGEWEGGRYAQRAISYYNENNKNSEYQKPIYNVGGGDPYYGILGYKKGGYLNIRNISLGYTFPKNLIHRCGLSNCRIFLQARNPGRIFSKIDFLELDASQHLTSTVNRGITLGLNVEF